MSEETKTLTPAERLKAVEAKKQVKLDALAEKREEQYATDREAILQLEEEKGITIHYSKPVKQYVPGIPVTVGVRAPDEAEYKRLMTKFNKNNVDGPAKVAALNELAETCWVYPVEPAIRKRMCEANSGLLASVGQFANKLAEVEVVEEGKD